MGKLCPEELDRRADRKFSINGIRVQIRVKNNTFESTNNNI